MGQSAHHPGADLAPLIAGLTIGHATSTVAATGCTVFLCPAGATAGVSVRGAAPGTRETDLLRPENRVDKVYAILLTGGSAFGLGATDGVVRWLFERGYGWPTPTLPVPIVPAAVIFDLRGDHPTWPDAALGYAACEAATSAWPVEGRVGVGTGATVGKILGFEQSSPGGFGAARLQLADGTTVGACVVVNAVGHVIDPDNGRIVAGPRLPDGTFGDSVAIMLGGATPHPGPASGTNTTLGVIWTDANLDKTACSRLASIAHNGLARAVRPAHTQYDGDTLFALSLPALDTPDNPPTSPPSPDLTLLAVAATEVVARAIVRAVTSSQ